MTLSLALLTGGREYVMSQLVNDVTWQRTRIKSPEGAASILVQIAKRTALNEASALILPEIQAFWTMYRKVNGPPPPDKGHDWYEGHDDKLLELFEPFVSVLSASWLGFATTDIRLWVDGEDEKLAKMFSEEVWKQLSWKRTDNQILSGVGITHDDLSQFGYMPPEPVQPPKQEYSEMRANAIINRIMLSMPDPAALEDDLDMASDDDDGLAIGAAERLGISMDDVGVMREARAMSGTMLEAWKNAIEAGELLDEATIYVDLDPQAANAVQEQKDYPDLPATLVRPALPPLPPPAGRLPPLPGTPPAGNGTKPLPPLPAVPGTPPIGIGAPPAPRKTRKGVEPPAGHIPLEVLRAIKEHAGTRDEDLANLMGISRPTLANIMKGKAGAWYIPDDSRRDAIKLMLDTHINALSVARSSLG